MTTRVEDAVQNIVIWWIGKRERGNIDENDLEQIGTYIAECFRKMCERETDERLWVDKRFGFIQCYWNNELQVCQVINEARAQGIVVTLEDAKKLPRFGFFTNLDCVFVDI